MEKNKKIIASLFFTTLITMLGTYIIWTPPYDYFCGAGTSENINCVNFINTISEPIFWSLLVLIPILFLLFLRHEVFTAWIKFAAFGFPVMLGGLLYYFNIEQSTGGWVGGPTESQVASVVLPGLFLIISFILIISKSIQLKKDGKNTRTPT